MKVIKVSYECIFPLAPYVNEKVGLEATIDGSAESEKEALTKLKQIAEEWHKANNQAIPDNLDPYGANPKWAQPLMPPGPPPVITIERTSEDKRIADLIRDMYACTELGGDNGLMSYQKVAIMNKEAGAVYDIMYKKLKNNHG